MSKLAEIEALLFVAGEDGLRVRQIAELLSIPPTGVTQSLEKLAEKYQKDESDSQRISRLHQPWQCHRPRCWCHHRWRIQ